MKPSIPENNLCAIHLDMGTTNARVWLMRGLEIIASARAQIGVADSARDGSREKICSGLKQLITEVRANPKSANHQPTICIAAGMITSSLGLVEIPHISAPVGEAELSNGIQSFEFPEITELPFYFVPGVKVGNNDASAAPMQFDLMRGEETLCIGLLKNEILKSRSKLLNLGSHWKAIGIDSEGRIASSVSSLSGELLHAAQTQTILASTVPQIWPEQLDFKWVAAGMDEQSKSGLARALYCVRLLQQNTTPENCFAFLCGAFISADLEKLLSREILKPNSHVVIAGSKPLGTAWQNALAHHSIHSTLLTDAERENSFLAGLHTFAQSVFAHERKDFVLTNSFAKKF